MSYENETRRRQYVGTTAVATRYDRSVRTVQRWLVIPPPGFPKPRKHNGRWLWIVDELDTYDDMNLQPAPAVA